MIAGLIAIGVYVILIVALANRQQYEILMALHLPLLALTGVGISLVGIKSSAQERFAFLLKAIEVGVTGGVYVIVGGMFAGITIGLFTALSIQLPADLIKALVAAGGGVICVLAVATVYDPRVAPLAQRFEQGLGKLVPTMMRLLLPLTLIVLVVYLFVIPFNFMQPFRNRDILIVYNAMLFAVMGLLIGATPLQEHDLPKYHGTLRAGILAVASLTVRHQSVRPVRHRLPDGAGRIHAQPCDRHRLERDQHRHPRPVDLQTGQARCGSVGWLVAICRQRGYNCVCRVGTVPDADQSVAVPMMFDIWHLVFEIDAQPVAGRR